MMKSSKSFFEQVRQLVKKIPAGKVATYGQIADWLGTRPAFAKATAGKDARTVGWALHANKNPDVPCHRVVNKEGRVALNYAFEGQEEQKRRLVEEGVEFVDRTHVNLEKHLWRG